ncbi:hypothetical protein B0T10DRAFT_496970 [Thelonectria olida]|uniref:Uncharacterized protein n=1 Tax=Thelonectria olida TaxID=1576542 RepID=A0A9P8VV60_9HYPO|nr:hypothetical protein B0T10DRAFT_496970 [Thelonectria olida]
MEETTPRDLSTIQKWLSSRTIQRTPSSAIERAPSAEGSGVVSHDMYRAAQGHADALTKGETWATLDMYRCRRLGEDGSESDDSNSDQVSSFRTALSCVSSADPDTTIQALDLIEDTPTNDEWEMLGEKFRGVRWLAVDSGFNEDWTDDTFPRHWPLEAVVIASACGHLITTPAILDGGIPHLVLLLTCGLRFEGPTNNELSEMDELEDPPVEAQEGELKIIYLPGRVSRWMYNKYAGGCEFPNYEGHRSKPPSRMRTLEILENDAIDTFQRFALACGHVVDNLDRLNIRSTSGLDCRMCPEDMFTVMLASLKNLKHLELSVSSKTFHDPAILPNLYNCFSPNLESLKFRGPLSLARTDTFGEWVKAFGRADYLPKLKRLSFVLDEPSGEAEKPADAKSLHSARLKVEALLKAAQGRNVAAEDFHDPWMVLGYFK